MRRFLQEHPRLAVAGAIGFVVFLALFGRAFMRAVRPQPLTRDDLSSRALEFASLEGWSSPNRLTWTFPVEGLNEELVRDAATATHVDAPNRETLHDPGWETILVTNPRGIPAAIRTLSPPDPLLSLELTPAGEVVRYFELSSPIAGVPIASFQGTRDLPFHSQQLDAVFDPPPQDHVEATDRDRDDSLALARDFFARHGIEPGPGVPSLAARDAREDTREVYLRWESAGPLTTIDVTRVVVWNGRVAGYDRALKPRTPGAARPSPGVLSELLLAIPAIGVVIGGVFIAVMVIIRWRQGELDVRSTLMVFFAYVTISLSMMALFLAVPAGSMSVVAGHLEIWFSVANVFFAIPLATLFFGFIVAGAWATGEGQAYVVWQRNLLRPYSSFLRGHFRSAQAAVPVAVGYSIAFALLGAVTVLGVFTPTSSSGSVAPLMAFLFKPIWPGPALQGLGMAISLTTTVGIFAMTYTRVRTRRTWVVVAVGTIVAIVTRSAFTVEQFFPGSHAVAVAVGVALAVVAAIVFFRYGPVALATSVYVYVVSIGAYPLVLTGNRAHMATGATCFAFAAIPAAAAAYGAYRPQEERVATIPAHIRRALDRLRIGEEFAVARNVQARLLPASAPLVDGLDVAGVCVPASEVGGDYFDYFKLADSRLGIAIGDVSGKGVGAAIYMTLTKSYMVTQSSAVADPVDVLARVNDHLRRNLSRGTFVTMVYAVFDTERRRLEYARAGHNPPLLIRASGDGDFLNAGGIPLGAASRTTFEAQTHLEAVDLEPGDLVLLYTDGVTEAMNLSNEEFGEERLIGLVRGVCTADVAANDVVEAILRDVRAFAGRAPQHDDITIVAVRVR